MTSESATLQVVDLPSGWELDEQFQDDSDESGAEPQLWIADAPDPDERAEILLTAVYWDDVAGDDRWFDRSDISSAPGEDVPEWTHLRLHDAPAVMRQRPLYGRTVFEVCVLVGNWIIRVEGAGAAAIDSIALGFTERVRLVID
jgi:hypothetical protein